MKEVGVPLTAMGRAAAADRDPATGNGAVSPAATTQPIFDSFLGVGYCIPTRHALG